MARLTRFLAFALLALSCATALASSVNHRKLLQGEISWRWRPEGAPRRRDDHWQHQLSSLCSLPPCSAACLCHPHHHEAAHSAALRQAPPSCRGITLQKMMARTRPQ
jgi:hypothetical protein